MLNRETTIAFNKRMVLATLDGSKTVTRQVLSARSLELISHAVAALECHGLPDEGPIHPNDLQYMVDMCPFGMPGDRLGVKEVIQADHAGREHFEPMPTIYEADGTHVLNPVTNQVEIWSNSARLSLPSESMPAWAQRIELEIVSVGIERLQEITDEQCTAEGIIQLPTINPNNPEERPFWLDYNLGGGCYSCVKSKRESFVSLWRYIRGKSFSHAPDIEPGGWETNPWVWVITFKMVVPAQPMRNAQITESIAT